MAAMLPVGGFAQSAVDALDITPVQLRGTARFVSMGGAFTSLGGDLSSLGQNPAGIGIYRSSDLGLTVDLSIRNSSTEANDGKFSNSETFFKFDNFGYVGVMPLSGALRSISWGVGYNRVNSFDRTFRGQNNPTGTSLSNYIAAYTNVSSDGLLEDNNFNPYLSTDNDWLSILAYNSYMISNTPGSDTEYAGLYQNGTHGDAIYDVRERGYTDEYNIDIAGNVSDVVFWGLGVGVVDIDYSRESYYSESMANAIVYNKDADRLVPGNAGFDLYNFKRTSGTGVNLKFGVIVRPVEMLRLGFAIHTPTWYHLTHTGFGDVSFNYTPDGSNNTLTSGNNPYSTPDFEYNSRLVSPWRFMFGASVVIGQQAIVSLDYERVAYGDMKMKYQSYSYNGFGNSFVDNTQANDDIKDFLKASNIIRLGIEYRLTRSFSLRAGYNYQTTNVKSDAADNVYQIPTSGTDPSYVFSNNTSNISVGLGYKYKNWYIDAAYQYVRRDNTYHAYTSFDGNIAPSAKLTDTHNNIVISTGVRF